MDTGHEVTVLTRDGSTQSYAGAAFSLVEGTLQVWRVDGTEVVLYAPGQWACVRRPGPASGRRDPHVARARGLRGVPARGHGAAVGRPAGLGGAVRAGRARHAIRRRGIAWRYGLGVPLSVGESPPAAHPRPRGCISRPRRRSSRTTPGDLGGGAARGTGWGHSSADRAGGRGAGMLTGAGGAA